MKLPTLYRPLRDLPPLAGVCDFERAADPGLSVDACVARLKRFHYALQRMVQIFNARLTAEPVYELKMAYAHHAYLCSLHVDAARERVAEMRHPPLGLDKVPDPHLQLVFDEILAAPETVYLLVGVYEVALPALIEAIGRHLVDTNPLADYPSVRLLKITRAECVEMRDYGRAAQECYRPEQEAAGADLAGWRNLLAGALAAAGALDGTEEKKIGAEIEPRFSAEGFDYSAYRSPRRDARFPDPYNMGVHAEEFLYDERFPPIAKTLMMYYKRLREIDVPEMMASIQFETRDRPWGFYRDMARQLWDEARHAMMGEVGFAKLGIDWPRLVMVNFTWSKGLNEQLTPKERHAVLWFIEQGLMTKTGKRFEWELGRDSGDPLAELFQDYDWADEVLHARIGREWYVSEYDSIEEASRYGSECWSKVVSDWEAWKKEGLTEHRNWWPDLYRAFCELRGETPDPEVLGFAATYAETRADLQRIAASG
ncbi:hypothetical protein BH23VER1_BH23VER1_24190 [soil metagenome]